MSLQRIERIIDEKNLDISSKNILLESIKNLGKLYSIILCSFFSHNYITKNALYIE